MSRSVLYLMHTTPAPLASGDRIRNFNLMRLLSQDGWDVHLFALASAPDPSERDREELTSICCSVELATIPPKLLRRLRAAADILRGRPFHTRYFVSRAAIERVAAICTERSFDAVVCSHLYMAPYVPANLWSRTIFDSVNVEASRLEKMAATGGLRALAARAQIATGRAYEYSVARSARVVIAVSPEERRYFAEIGGVRRVELLPNGVDLDSWVPRAALPQSRDVLYVGSLDYGANASAARLLIDEVVPRLARAARLTIVGANPPRRLRTAAARATFPVELPGFVPDVEPYFERARVLAVPLRSGGGTRLKILEALARGVPVVTTSVGCEGLDVVHERDVLVADDVGSFAAAVERLLEDDDLALRLTTAGTRTAAAYDWRTVGAGFAAAVGGLARDSTAASSSVFGGGSTRVQPR